MKYLPMLTPEPSLSEGKGRDCVHTLAKYLRLSEEGVYAAQPSEAYRRYDRRPG
jgi:hypothetical protein